MLRIKKGPKSAQTRFVLIGLTPIMAFFLVVTVFPVLAGIVLAFFRYNLLQTHPTAFVGLENFKKILSDSMFWLSLKNTFFYVVVIVPNILISSLLVALAINPLGRKSKGLYRAFYFTPCMEVYLSSHRPIKQCSFRYWIANQGVAGKHRDASLGCKHYNGLATDWIRCNHVTSWVGWGSTFILRSCRNRWSK